MWRAFVNLKLYVLGVHASKTEVDAGAPQVTTGHSKLLQEAAGNLPAVF
jgi:hypothetical protein